MKKILTMPGIAILYRDINSPGDNCLTNKTFQMVGPQNRTKSNYKSKSNVIIYKIYFRLLTCHHLITVFKLQKIPVFRSNF